MRIHISKIHLIALIICVTASNAYAVQKISGKDFLDRTIRYDTNNVKSYGRIVTGVVNYSTENADKNTIKVNDKHILFCGTGELYEYEAESNEYSVDGSWLKTVRKSESKDNTSTVSQEKSDQAWIKFNGLTGYYQDLLSKCSNSISKFPRIEVPLARSEGTVFHAILDTYGNDGKLKHIWIKDQKVYKTEMRDLSGQPLVLSGETIYEYKFSEPRNYSISRYEVDCKSDKLAISQMIEYKPKGEVLKSESIDINRLRLDSVIPNSIGEAIQKFTCGL
jgi:uncharacterized ubiquitin-like protein YukD